MVSGVVVTIITKKNREEILSHLPVALRPVFKVPYYTANVLLANKPEFVVIGTGRCGTKFTARFLDNLGIGCSHEAYYTPEGPLLRNKNRYFRASVDASWLAVPFLPDSEQRVLHQVRNPIGVISSFYKLGFFDAKHYPRHRRYVDFAKQYFEFSSSPARSCARWYIQWNKRCEAITTHRIRLESFSENADALAAWLQIEPSNLKLSADFTPVNARNPIIDFDQEKLLEQLKGLPEFSELRDLAEKYKYTID